VKHGRNQGHSIFRKGSFMSSVRDTIYDIIAKESGIDRAKITPEATLKDLDIQSLDAVQILFEIEDHFKITMPDRDPNFDTESVQGLIDTVEKLAAEQGANPAAS
jgi:acyl carrier protein